MFSHSDVDARLAEMARLTENLNLQRGLLRRLDEMPKQVELMDKVRVEKIHREDAGSWLVVQLSNGTSIRARLLVSSLQSMVWDSLSCAF